MLSLCGCASSDGDPGPSKALAKLAEPSPCVREEPEAILESGSVFTKAPEREAIEIVQTGSPVKLTIRHFGCAHYLLDFDFVWPATRMPVRRIALLEAAALLEKLHATDAMKASIKSIVGALRMLARSPKDESHRLSELETVTLEAPTPHSLRVRYDVSL